MLEEVVKWVEAILPLSAYEFSRGQWVDGPALADKRIAAVSMAGGPGPDVEDRRPRFRVILLGPRNARSAVAALEADIDLLVTAAIGGFVPCKGAAIRAVGEPVGPGYTTENRAWYSLELEVLF